MVSFPPLLLLALVVLLVFGFEFDSCKHLCVVSLSLDDSFLSSSVQRLQKEHEEGIPGIWKLNTDSLPYELDIRSKLDRSFSNDNNNNNKNNNNDSYDNRDSILFKLNKDGTFKQCDEGYREGRWMTGRWKLQLQTAKEQPKNPTANNNPKILSWLLILAMNRQYFGPPFDVLLEARHASNTTLSKASAGAVVDDNDLIDDARQKQPGDDFTMPAAANDTTLKRWQGLVRKGKFLRPSPGKHPLDREIIDCTSSVLEDAESLGNFSLEQVLSATALDRTSNNNKQTTTENEDNRDTLSRRDSSSSSSSSTEDDTFFFPCSPYSDDAGFLQ